MMLPDIGPDPLSPPMWARKVSRYEPHGLDVLEAHVVAQRTNASEWTKSSALQKIWAFLVGFVPWMASIGGFAALLGDDRAIRLGRMTPRDAGDIPFAAICYAIAALGVVVLLVDWVREGRKRTPGIRLTMTIIFVFGALGIPVAYMLAAREGVDMGLMMVPTYVMMGLAVTLFILVQMSPRPEAKVQEIALEDLDEKTVKRLLMLRGRAIDTLVQRGLIDGDVADINALKARPLGRLHIEEDT
ncbi:hypothetical protein [Gracilibacillus alcaliphilus]|uniref:hypothetical protein n=1 Tax=Gracilibacillus alcaliphilus TaxID=1401441 RepID=UPI0019579DE8|nr:hypothetical protein [Gracilibacillus alcaliphilus]MBM7674976.1 hypothetical protein [Gracilibacillus alcaliphilus]